MLTILQALKKIKHLDRKIEVNQERIKKWCSYIDPMDTPPQYDTNKLIQSVNDMLKEKARIRHALHRTNALHTVKYKGKKITVDDLLIMSTLTIPSMIHTLKLQRRKEKPYRMTKDDLEQKVILQYDPKERDRTVDGLENDLMEMDAILDEINITTDIEKYIE
jgi:hypothetical protein